MIIDILYGMMSDFAPLSLIFISIRFAKHVLHAAEGLAPLIPRWGSSNEKKCLRSAQPYFYFHPLCKTSFARC